MQLFDDMARQRAQIYRWFSLLLFQELSDEALAGLRDKNNLALMNGLKFIPELLLPTRQFQRRLCAALKRKARQQELAADFAALTYRGIPIRRTLSTYDAFRGTQNHASMAGGVGTRPGKQ